ncbi:inositol monophosphatase family protein, partial [Streptomyces roseus]|uniref:inositol monophosphatase family protein n=1 Tax=Streptomyces roseus TaxID=66430 RepID=UPI0033C6C2A9
RANIAYGQPDATDAQIEAAARAAQAESFIQAGARADLLPGALLVTEAGGRISDAEGRPWTPESESFLAAAPGVHAEAVATLSR